MSWTGLHKLADVIFGITQKPLCNIHVKYIIKLGQVLYITSKGIVELFWTCFVIGKVTGHLLQAPFVFDNLVY